MNAIPHTYTPAGNRNAIITVPDDGDAANAASIQTPLEQLAEELELVARRTPGGSSAVATGFQIPLLPFDNLNSRFAPAGVGILQQNDVTDAGGVLLPVPIAMVPCTITAVFLTLRNVAFHSALPATMPQLQLYRFNRSTYTSTVVGTQVDTSASTAAYAAAHTIALTVSESVNSSNFVYYVSFNGETGANSVPDLQVVFCSVSMIGV